MADPIIVFAGVNKYFGRLHVLRDVDLEVARGEVLVVCGPSGSGKSTLIRCNNRLEPIQSGRVVVDGQDVNAPGIDLARLRAEIGMVFQQFNLYPHMTALQNVTLAPVHVRRLVPVLRAVGGVYVEFFRNVPLLVWMFFWYFGAPQVLPHAAQDWLNRHGGEFIAAVVALGVYHGH
jgi:ABC-type Fe3+/spermidine/putrescine transport system ATPase subunit